MLPFHAVAPKRTGIAQVAGHDAKAVGAVAFLHEEGGLNVVLSGGADGSVYAWDMRTAERVSSNRIAGAHAHAALASESHSEATLGQSSAIASGR
jgi:hypothetical protein